MKVLLKDIVILILVHLTAGSVLAQDYENCSLKKDSNGIKVYSCKTEKSAYKVIKATFTLESTIDEYLKLVRDVDNYKNWHYKSSNARILKHNSPNDIIYYTQIEAPWPVSNRDLILHLELIKNKTSGSLSVLLNSLPEYLPEQEGLVRVPYSSSTMILNPVDTNTIEVDYTILVNPGGSLPVWVVNLVSAQGPYETFKKLRDILESKSHAKRQMSGN
jgi:hypothetical protein